LHQGVGRGRKADQIEAALARLGSQVESTTEPTGHRPAQRYRATARAESAPTFLEQARRAAAVLTEKERESVKEMEEMAPAISSINSTLSVAPPDPSNGSAGPCVPAAGDLSEEDEVDIPSLEDEAWAQR